MTIVLSYSGEWLSLYWYNFLNTAFLSEDLVLMVGMEPEYA